MSTCISAIMSHRWPEFSVENIEQARLSFLQSTSAIGPKLISESGNAEQDFANYGAVLYRLSSGFSLKFCRNVLALNHDDRWSAFLMDTGTRRNFLVACQQLAKVAKSNEIMILPEGTILDYDDLGGNIDIRALKNLAIQKFGAPDLNIDTYYSEEEIARMGYKRVHYFLIQRNT